MPTPDSSATIPFSKPSLGSEEIEAVTECLRSGWITSGPRCQEFEQEMAARTGAAHAVSVTSATAGLHMLMTALDLEPGDEVITTPMTWPATVNAIVLAGGVPVFADVENETLNISVEQVRRRLSPRTVAVVPVHFAGQPCDMRSLSELIDGRGIRVVEDAAHAIGTEYEGQPIGSHGDAAVFSFHPIKNITTGEGGMITTSDDDLVHRLRLLRFHGVERDAWRAYGTTRLPHYDVTAPGFKYNMTDLQAAIGVEQLRKLDDFIERRRTLASRYDEALGQLAGLVPLGRVGYASRHAHHLYVVKLTAAMPTREQLMTEVIEAGVGLGLHFLAVHRLTYYRQLLGDLSAGLPVASDASDRIFSLPLYPELSESQQGRVIDVLGDVLRRHQ